MVQDEIKLFAAVAAVFMLISGVVGLLTGVGINIWRISNDSVRFPVDPIAYAIYGILIGAAGLIIAWGVRALYSSVRPEKE